MLIDLLNTEIDTPEIKEMKEAFNDVCQVELNGESEKENKNRKKRKFEINYNPQKKMKYEHFASDETTEELLQQMEQEFSEFVALVDMMEREERQEGEMQSINITNREEDKEEQEEDKKEEQEEDKKEEQEEDKEQEEEEDKEQEGIFDKYYNKLTETDKREIIKKIFRRKIKVTSTEDIKELMMSKYPEMNHVSSGNYVVTKNDVKRRSLTFVKAIASGAKHVSIDYFDTFEDKYILTDFSNQKILFPGLFKVSMQLTDRVKWMNIIKAFGGTIQNGMCDYYLLGEEEHNHGYGERGITLSQYLDVIFKQIK